MGDRADKWAIHTYARLKPRAGAEDEEAQFVPYTIHKPRAHKGRALELLKSPFDFFGEPTPTAAEEAPQGRGVPFVPKSGVRGRSGDVGWEHDIGVSWAATNANRSSSSWQFDEVFDTDASQEEVYGKAAAPLVQGVLDGFNATLFAYGQTGSGKTFTVQGGEGYQFRGIIPRAIQAVFEETQRRSAHFAQMQTARAASSTSASFSLPSSDPGLIHRVSLSFCEIYNEHVFDLLTSEEHRNGPIETWPKVELMEDRDGVLHLKGLKTYAVESAEDALSLFFIGVTNRITSETPMNHASSRSHAIFTLYVETHTPVYDGADGEDEEEEEEDPAEVSMSSRGPSEPRHYDVTYGKLHVVDLAGSERVYKSFDERSDNISSYAASSAQALVHAPPRPHHAADHAVHDAKTRQEGRNINLSLHYLEQVIVSLHESSSLSQSTPARRGRGRGGEGGVSDSDPHIPYRNSVLTSYLRDSLGGNCRTSFVVTLSLASVNFDESVSACRFASRCALLRVTIDRNLPKNWEREFKRLKRKFTKVTMQHEAALDRATGALVECTRVMGDMQGCLLGHMQDSGEDRSSASMDVALCEALAAAYIADDADAFEAIHGDPTTKRPIALVAPGSSSNNGPVAAFDGAVDLAQTHATACETLVHASADVANGATLRGVIRCLRRLVQDSQSKLADAERGLEDAHRRLVEAEASAKQNHQAQQYVQREVDEGLERQKVAETATRTNLVSIRSSSSRESTTTELQPQPQPESKSEDLASTGSTTPPTVSSARSATALATTRPPMTLATSAGTRAAWGPLHSRVCGLLSSPKATNGGAYMRIRSQLQRGALEAPIEELAAMLLNGGMFIKHGRLGKPHARYFSLAPESLAALQWRRQGEAKIRGELPLRQFLWVQLGSKSKGAASAPPSDDGPGSGGRANDAFVVLLGAEKKLTLQIDMGNRTELPLRDRWARAFALLLGAIHGNHDGGQGPE